MNVFQLIRAGGSVSLVLLLAFCCLTLGYGVTEEAPVGTVLGRATMSESGKPLPNATVILRPIDQTGDDPLPTRSARTGPDGAFTIRGVAAGGYSVEAYSKAHETFGEQVYVREATPTELELVLNPSAPFFSVYANQHVYLPGEAAFVQAHGFAPADDIRVVVYRVEFEAIEAAQGRVEALMSPWANGDRTDPTKRPGLTEFRKTRVPIVGRDGEGVFRQDVRIEPLPEGVYYVRLLCDKGVANTGVFVSRIALVTKTAGTDVLGYVTDLRTGAPIAGADVYPVGGRPVRTDANGLARLKVAPTTRSDSFGVVARYGDSRAVCSPWVSSEDDASDLRIWHVTDRPVYRPGDTVSYKGVVRKRVGSGYVPPVDTSAQIVIRDPDGEIIERATLPVNAHGSFHGTFATNAQLTGTYLLETVVGGAREVQWVEVASYRKPQFKITVSPLKPAFAGREPVRMKVKCEYYFGGPVVGASVEGSVYARPEWANFTPDDEEYGDYEEYESSYLGDYAGDIGEVRTDANGEAIIAWKPTRYASQQGWSWSLDRRITFEVYVSEADQYFTGKGAALLTQGEYAMSVDSASYVVAPGDKVPYTLKVWRNGTSRPISAANVRVEYGYEEYDRARKEYRFLRDGVLDVVTGPDGTAVFDITPNRPGDMRIKAETRDTQGNVIQAQAWLWAFQGASQDLGGPAPDLQVVLDKKRYEAGNVAKAVVRTKDPGGFALVTVEADQVYFTRVVKLAGPATVVEIPVRPDYLPNVFVAAAYVRGKDLSTAQRRLVLDPSIRKMSIRVTPDREVFKPGDQVTYAIEARGPDGEPVATELALGVVDESVYAIREDSNDPLTTFYPKRWNGVSTNFSFPELYLDGGDKGPAEIEIRREFRDTASWQPTVTTGPDGKANVTVDLPDNLGAWRATVSGISDDGACGKGKAQVVARKELMVRLSAPAVFTTGDEVAVTAIVNQFSGRGANVKVRLTVENGQIEGSATLSLRIGDGGSGAASWKVKAGDLARMTLKAEAWIDGGPTDGMEIAVPVRPHGRKAIQWEAQRFDGRKELRFSRLKGASIGTVRMSFAPTLAGAALESVRELVGYPYGCVEQTMSRYMPAVIVAKALRDLGRPDPELEAQIADIASQSVARLNRMQHYDGGFGWWEQDDSAPWTTALVLEGLARSEKAGYAVPVTMRKKALEWAKKYLARAPDPKALNQDDVYLAYACLLNGQADGVRERLIWFKQKDLGAESLAILVLTYDLLADLGRRDAAYRDLMARAIEMGGGLGWTDGFSRAPSRGLQAVLATDPDGPNVDRVVTALLRKRTPNEWIGTYETAQALIGIADVLRKSGELGASYTASIKLDGQVIDQVEVSPGNALSTRWTREWEIADLAEGDHALEVDCGAGRGYVTLLVTQTPQVASLGRLVSNSGITVERTFHSLEAAWLESGQQRLQPSKKPMTRFRSGQAVRCRVEVEAEAPWEYVIVEVPIPANLVCVESLDPETWNWWWSGQTLLDDRIALFARRLNKGVSVFEFNMRAESPGRAAALPVDVYDMYAPDRRGSTASIQLEVTPR